MEKSKSPEPPEIKNTLRVEDLVKIYRGKRVVDSVSIQVDRGEVVGLLGPNGAGKTTTFYMITGMIRPNEGRIFLDQKEITRVPMYRRARMGIGYLPQEPSVFRKLTVEENIMLGAWTFRKDRKLIYQRIEENYERFNN